MGSTRTTRLDGVVNWNLWEDNTGEYPVPVDKRDPQGTSKDSGRTVSRLGYTQMVDEFRPGPCPTPPTVVEGPVV